MAPNKKKKKPVSNPARGFATVSVASKVKEPDSAEGPASTSVAEALPDDDNATALSTLSAEARHDNQPPGNATSIENMTPEELEAHLEESELQSLLDAKSTAYKSDAARQVTRLHAERRQLRAQAYKLNTHPWLEDDTVDRLLLAPGISSPQANHPAPHVFSSNDSKRLLDLWILQRVLLSLKFNRVSDAMDRIVLLAVQGRLASDTGLIWGLAEAFDWYANNESMVELSDYGLERKEDALPGEDQTLQQSDPKKLSHQCPVQQNESQKDPELAFDNTSQSDDTTDSDGDDDPEVLAAQYLHLRQKLWKRQRGLHSRERKGDLKTSKLQERVLAIERDILFDKDAARAQWLPIETEMEAEEGRKRKATKTAQERMKLDAEADNAQQNSRDAGSDEELFGDMFTAPGETLQGALDSVDTNKSVHLVSFGKWSGLSPRHFLEQTSRSIDPRASVKTLVLANTTSSARHKINLTWSAAQKYPNPLTIAALPSEVVKTIQPHQWTIEMDSIAASDSEQSIAYVSTIMLFLLLSQTGQEHQHTLRLPTVWREEFAKLVNRRQELVNESDRAELRELRKVIRSHERTHEDSTVISHQENPRPTHQSVSTSRLKPPEIRDFDPRTLVDSWRARAASPAFQKMEKIREELPIFAYKGLILRSIAEHPIIIVCAETGSGKSTQTGSFILEEELSSGRDCRILVTQPRRISAISLARRVSVELGEGKTDIGTLGSLIGYAIRLESKASPSTRLTFATTGVLLRMLESSPNLEQLDYLILDEVHERTIEMDLLFIALSRLQQRRPSLKIVLMSATVDARKFSDYFGRAPILEIPGRTYPVEIKFLEDAIENTNDIKRASRAVIEQEESSQEDPNTSRANSPSVLTYLDSYTATTRQRLNSMDEYRIDYELITILATAIATKPKFVKYSSAILIFMPGIAEIRRLYNAISGTNCFSTGWDIHMLHSSFSTEELEKAFAIPTHGRRKVVIATNIAETGITIPDVTAVIDTCKEKIMRFDERRQLSKLTEGFISRSSAKQRRGRAARVQDGLCFHLVTRYRYDNQMLEQQVPEMVRLSLQDPILRIKIWDMGSIEDTFQAAIDPPSSKNILRAIERLKDAGALTKSEQLTPLGQRIARLPLDVTFAKLAILGAIFECADPVLAIISILTSKTVFLVSSGADPRTTFARSESDLLTSLAAYEGWKKAKLANQSSEFCRKNRLNEQNLLQVEDQKVQLLVYLVDGGLITLDAKEKAILNRARVSNIRGRDIYQMPQRYNRSVGDDLLLSLIAMAFYPRILTREGRGWRNVYTNQQVALRRESVNYAASRPPRWLSFSETMQTKMGSLNVFETSRIPDLALALLLGDADVKMFAGVVALDHGRVKLAVKQWRQALALKRLRKGVRGMLERRYRKPEEPMSETDRYWIETLRMMTEA